MVLAILAHRVLPPECEIDLLNVAFANPHRQTPADGNIWR